MEYHLHKNLVEGYDIIANAETFITNTVDLFEKIKKSHTEFVGPQPQVNLNFVQTLDKYKNDVRDLKQKVEKDGLSDNMTQIQNTEDYFVELKHKLTTLYERILKISEEPSNITANTTVFELMEEIRKAVNKTEEIFDPIKFDRTPNLGLVKYEEPENFERKVKEHIRGPEYASWDDFKTGTKRVIEKMNSIEPLQCEEIPENDNSLAQIFKWHRGFVECIKKAPFHNYVDAENLKKNLESLLENLTEIEKLKNFYQNQKFSYFKDNTLDDDLKQFAENIWKGIDVATNVDEINSKLDPVVNAVPLVQQPDNNPNSDPLNIENYIKSPLYSTDQTPRVDEKLDNNINVIGNVVGDPVSNPISNNNSDVGNNNNNSDVGNNNSDVGNNAGNVVGVNPIINNNSDVDNTGNPVVNPVVRKTAWDNNPNNSATNPNNSATNPNNSANTAKNKKSDGEIINNSSENQNNSAIKKNAKTAEIENPTGKRNTIRNGQGRGRGNPQGKGTRHNRK